MNFFFNIDLLEVESRTILKKIFMITFFDHSNVLSWTCDAHESISVSHSPEWCAFETFCLLFLHWMCFDDGSNLCSKFKFPYIPCHCCLKEIMLLHGNSATIFWLWYKMLLMLFPTLHITLMSGYIFLLVWHEVSTFCFLREYGSIVQHQYIHLHCILNQVSFHNP